MTVYDVRDKLKQRYMGESEEQARLNYQKYEEEREKQRKILQNAREEIRKVGQTRYDKILNLGANIILVILNICLLITIFADVDAIKGVGAWIVSIVGVVGDIAFLSFQKSRVKKLIKRIACHAKDREMDKKREEYEKILGMDMYDTLL